MGLDISTNRDYMRFNWDGSRDFRKWSKKHLGLEPFPGWDGGNGSTVIFKGKPKGEREVNADPKDAKEWIKEFELYVKEDADDELSLKWGEADAINNFTMRAWCGALESKGEKTWMRPEICEWGYLQAHAWRKFLIQALRAGYINYF